MLTGVTFGAFASGFGVCLFDLDTVDACVNVANSWVDVFQAMQSSEEKLPDEKDASAIKKYFEKVYPAMDFERVYASDMKKMIKWFGILTKNDIEIKLSEEPAEDETGDESEIAEQETEVKEPEAIPAAEEPEPKKAKTAKAKKSEPVVSSEEATPDSETKAAKKKTTKK